MEKRNTKMEKTTKTKIEIVTRISSEGIVVTNYISI